MQRIVFHRLKKILRADLTLMVFPADYEKEEGVESRQTQKKLFYWIKDILCRILTVMSQWDRSPIMHSFLPATDSRTGQVPTFFLIKLFILNISYTNSAVSFFDRLFYIAFKTQWKGYRSETLSIVTIQSPTPFKWCQ